MKRQRMNIRSERGVALVYMAVLLAVLLIFTGLAVDSGRAYVVKAQLTQGRRWRGARRRAQFEQRQSARRKPSTSSRRTIRRVHGHDLGDRPGVRPGFFTLTTDPVTGVNVVTRDARPRSCRRRS